MCFSVKAVLVLRLLLTFVEVIKTENFGKMVGGTEVEMDKYPYLITIHDLSRPKYAFVTMGTLISPKLVLTVDHRFQNVRELKHMLVFQLTETMKQRDANEVPNFYNVSVKKIHKHPSLITSEYFYDKQGQRNNIALVELKEAFKMKPVDLFDECSRLPPGIPAHFVGQYNKTLRGVELTTMSQEECQNAYGGLHQLTDDQICANKSALEGSTTNDHGMPLLVNNSQAGILLGYPGVEKDYKIFNKPIVFTSVSYHREWINQIMSKVDAVAKDDEECDTVDTAQEDKLAAERNSDREFKKIVIVCLIISLILSILILLVLCFLAIKT